MKRDERREGEEETDRLRVKGGKGYDRIEKKSRGIGDQITFMIFRFCITFKAKIITTYLGQHKLTKWYFSLRY